MKGPLPAQKQPLTCALLGASVAIVGLHLVCKPLALEAAMHGPDSVLIKGWYLDTDPQWEMEADWAYGVPAGQGGEFFGLPDPTSAATGRSVLGMNLDGDHSGDPGGPFYLRSPVVDCSEHSNVPLRFMRWLNIDWQPYMQAYIEVTGDGRTWIPIWENDCCTDIIESAWSLHEFDLSETADGRSSVQVRWSHTINSGIWVYSGWNLDDIEFVGTPDADRPCPGDLDGDGGVGGSDLTQLLAHWGTADPTCDLDGSGAVDGADLAQILADWGACTLP